MLDRYREVVEAYLAGLETRLSASLPIDRIVSVVGFLSRIDLFMDDPVLEKQCGASPKGEIARARCPARCAIASAKIAPRPRADAQAVEAALARVDKERFAARL